MTSRRNFIYPTVSVISATIMIALLCVGCPGSGAKSWRSALYPEDWTPEFAGSDGRFLHDFSYAGYHNGEVPLPDSFPGLDTFDVTAFGADREGQSDATTSIQAAIDSAQKAGGVVYFPAGLYKIDGTLLIAASRVVLHGDGAQASKLYFTRSKGLAYQSHITFRGDVVSAAEFPLVQDGVIRSFDVHVSNAAELPSGTDVSVGWVITDAFIEEHGMTGTWKVSNGQWRPFFRRTVTNADTVATPHRISLDVPLRYPAKIRYNASVRVETGYLSECGVENLGIANAVDWDGAWAEMQVHAIAFDQVKDSWIRGVESFESPHPQADGYHLQSSGLLVVSSKRVTIADSVFEKAQNRGGGGCGYLYEISRSSEILIRDCTGNEGRHNFIQNWDFGTSGCVFLRCHTSGGKNVLSSSAPVAFPAYSEYHHSLAMACLVDSCVIDDGWYGGNRKSESSGAGHSVTQSVYWNSSGNGVLRSFQFGDGYVIGTRNVAVTTSMLDPSALETAPEDFVEGLNTGSGLQPGSLFVDQLERRTKP